MKTCEYVYSNRSDLLVYLFLPFKGHEVLGYLVVQDRYVLICRVTELLLYVLPPEHLRKGQHSIYPVAIHKWQRTIEIICLMPQIPSKLTRAGRLPLVNILLRFRNYLPSVRTVICARTVIDLGITAYKSSALRCPGTKSMLHRIRRCNNFKRQATLSIPSSPVEADYRSTSTPVVFKLYDNWLVRNCAVVQ